MLMIFVVVLCIVRVVLFDSQSPHDISLKRPSSSSESLRRVMMMMMDHVYWKTFLYLGRFTHVLKHLKCNIILEIYDNVIP